MSELFPLSWYRDKTANFANGAIVVELAEVVAWLRFRGADTRADELEQMLAVDANPHQG